MSIASKFKARREVFENRRTPSESQEAFPKQVFSGIALSLFFTCWLVFALHFATNIVREIYPAITLGDNLSFDVSEYLDLHPDIFEIPGRGAFINNNPGASILGAIPYSGSKGLIERASSFVVSIREDVGVEPPEYESIYPLAREFYSEAHDRGIDVKLGLSAWVMQAFLMAPLSALSAVAIFYTLTISKISPRNAALYSMLYAFATPIFYRTATLNHNLLVGHFAFFSFFLLWFPIRKGGTPKKSAFLLSGLLTGWTLILDYSGLLIILCISFYALMKWRNLPKADKSSDKLIVFSVGIVVCILGLLLYQWNSFGNPFFPAQHYMSPTKLSLFGYNGITWPQIDLLWKNAFSYQYGLFVSGPILLLALFAPLSAANRRFMTTQRLKLGREEIGLIVSISILFFLLAASNQFTRMQFNSGVRHVVPVIPFLFLIVVNALERMSSRLVVAIGIMATYWSWSLSMYRDVELGNGVFEAIVRISTQGLRLPWLTTLHNLGLVPSWLSASPFVLFVGAVLFLIWYRQLKNLSKQ